MTYSNEELKQLMELAAERGAEECLSKMGITSENIREIKNMLDVYKAVKRGILQGISKLVMLLMLGGAAGAAAYYGLGK